MAQSPVGPTLVLVATATTVAFAACGPSPVAKAPPVVEPTPTHSAAASAPPPSGSHQRLSDATRLSGCKSVAAATCKRLKSCSPALFETLNAGDEHCLEKETASCLEFVVPSGTHATVADLDHCGAAVASASCGVAIGGHLRQCASLGWRAVGEPCSLMSQCSSGRCELEGDSGCGACQPAYQLGDACKHGCGRFLECAGGKCIEALGQGELCQANECAYPFVCHGGKCSPRAKLGEICDILNSSAPECELDLSCDFDTNRCVHNKLVAAGERCEAGERCRGGRCRDGVCKLRLGEGAACDAKDYKRLGCEEPQRCIAQRCTLRSTLACGK